jgi:transmembrane sensor
MERISELAAHWVVREDAGPLNTEDSLALAAWLDADPRHRGAYIRARAQWSNLDRLAAVHGPARPVVETAAPVPTVSRRQLLAASVATLTVLGGGAWWWRLHEGATRYISGIGEIRRIALDDGSTIVLNTASEATVRWEKSQRNLRLVTGEALFEVAHDKLRPFVVHVNECAVRAVGTAFAVRRETDQIDVTVTEGVVELVNNSTASSEAAPFGEQSGVQRVVANQRVIIKDGHALGLQAVTAAEAERHLAWLEGMVAFDGESLRTAIAEINRHNRRQIVVEDAALAGKPIVGSFRANDLDAFSAAAAAVLKARVIRDGDVIHLVPAATATPR